MTVLENYLELGGEIWQFFRSGAETFKNEVFLKNSGYKYYTYHHTNAPLAIMKHGTKHEFQNGAPPSKSVPKFTLYPCPIRLMIFIFISWVFQKDFIFERFSPWSKKLPNPPPNSKNSSRTVHFKKCIIFLQKWYGSGYELSEWTLN